MKSALNQQVNDNIILKKFQNQSFGQQVFSPFSVLEEQKVTKYKSKAQMVFFGIIIAIGGVCFGYALAFISTIDPIIFKKFYNIDWDKNIADAVLIGIMPAAAALGSILNHVLLPKVSRTLLLFLAGAMMILATGLMLITHLISLLIGRMLQGFSMGIYVAICPILLREIIAKELRQQIIPLFSLGKILGIIIAYSFKISLEDYTYQYKFIIFFNGILAFLQMILIFFFLPQSPIERCKKEKQQEAKTMIIKHYKRQFVQEVFEECMKDTFSSIMPAQCTEEDKIILQQKQNRAHSMAINIAILRQFIGGNGLVTFSGQIIAVFSKSLAKYTPLSINIVQIVGNALAVGVLANRFGTRSLYLFGIGSLVLANLGIGVVLIMQEQVPILIGMCLYMLLHGGLFQPVAWAYPAEILSAEDSLLPNIISWLFTALETTIPPLIVASMPSHNAYPIFFFAAAYSIYGYIYGYYRFVESQGLTLRQIIDKF